MLFCLKSLWEMRFKEKDFFKNLGPSKSVYKPALQNLAADKGEHEKLLASIASIKEGIEVCLAIDGEANLTIPYSPIRLLKKGIKIS